jgi:hypothetical protein
MGYFIFFKIKLKSEIKKISHLSFIVHSIIFNYIKIS